MSASLVNIRTLEEDRFVLSLAPANDLWIGYTDQKVEGYWQWTEQNRSNTNAYSNWAQGQPDDHQNQDCAIIWGGISSPRWDDRQCSDRKRYVCKKGVFQLNKSARRKLFSAGS